MRAWAPSRWAASTVAALARALALGDRDHPGDHGGGEQHADAGEQRPQAPVGAALALGLALARRPALVEELALELVQLGVVLGGPVERRGEPGAAVELGGIALGVAPLPSRADQVVMEAATLGVLLEPAAQPRPLAQQRLVGDLDRALVDGQQPALGEHGERPGGVRVALELELVERDAAADERLRLLVVAGEPQQHRPRPAPLGLAQALVGVLGQAGDRPVDAAGALVGAVAKRAPVAALPELEQRGREQRQAAGLAGDVADQRRDQPRLDPQPGPARRAARSPGAARRGASARPGPGWR